MPQHSVIIPHKNRLKRLILCVDSIERSAAACGIDQFEIIISDQHSDFGAGSVQSALSYVTRDMSRIRVLRDGGAVSTALTPEGTVEVFSKPRALNRGIKVSQGQVLSFLDCDALVGKYWMNGPKWLADGWWADTTRLCYRVRYLPVEMGDWVPSRLVEDEIDECFKRYSEYPIAHEGYASPEIPASGCWDPNLTFGNSQFSIRRSTLGNLRCDERFKAGGWEDLAFIAAIWIQAGETYKGTIRTEPNESLFHIRNIREKVSWDNTWLNTRNHKMYLKMLGKPTTGA